MLEVPVYIVQRSQCS